MTSHRPPAPAADAGPAHWLAARLTGAVGTVCGTVPAGFERYARVLHPADGGRPVRVRWAELAAATGRTMHPLAQFERIATPATGRPLPGRLGSVGAPRTGDLDPDALRALCTTLRPHTPGSAPCWFGVWTGWGVLAGGGSVMQAVAADQPAAPPPRDAPDDWQLDLRAPTFHLPDRDYYLFTGSLDDAGRIGSWATSDWFVPRSPNLFWPDDRSWCVASEVDFDSTLVAGPADLIARVVGHPDLEAWPVEPGDSLTWDADVINQP